MIISRLINVVDSHTAGEPTRVVTGGLPPIPGETMADRMAYLEKEMDHFRTSLMQEPRGHRDMFGAILTDPLSPGADIGVIFMNAGGYLSMCGHGSIGAVTVAIETGLLTVSGNEAEIVLDTPSGLVRAGAKVENGRVTEVSIINVPSFLYKEKVVVEITGFGRLQFDIAFGGNFFAIIPAKDLGLKVEGKNTSGLVRAGMKIKEEINEQVSVSHPEKPHINAIDLVEIYEKHSRLHATNAVIFGQGALDRSPCGTGTSAKLATLYARGDIEIGEEYLHESVFGTEMRARVLEETKVGDIRAIVPEVKARAYITGFSQLVVDPEDPLKDGFLPED